MIICPFSRAVGAFRASKAMPPGERWPTRWTLVENLCQYDPFLVLADYADYVDCQNKVAQLWKDRESWTRMSILNTARTGKFSSDRAIREYCDEIWNVKAVSVD